LTDFVDLCDSTASTWWSLTITGSCRGRTRSSISSKPSRRWWRREAEDRAAQPQRPKGLTDARDEAELRTLRVLPSRRLTRCAHLQLRVHLLQRLQRGDGGDLPELRRRARAAAGEGGMTKASGSKASGVEDFVN